MVSGEVRQKPPEGCPALLAGGFQLLAELRGLAAPCPCDVPAAALGQLRDSLEMGSVSRCGHAPTLTLLLQQSSYN